MEKKPAEKAPAVDARRGPARTPDAKPETDADALTLDGPGPGLGWGDVFDATVGGALVRFLRLLSQGTRLTIATAEAGLPLSEVRDRVEKDEAFRGAVQRAAADGILAIIDEAVRPRRPQ